MYIHIIFNLKRIWYYINSKKKIIFNINDDIEVQGKDINLIDHAGFKANGTAVIELTSSAIAKLEGSFVQIN